VIAIFLGRAVKESFIWIDKKFSDNIHEITNPMKALILPAVALILTVSFEDLQTIDPERVILFGSYAYGTPNRDSDIELYVVTKENFIPENFEQNLQVKKKVYMALSNFRKKYASDIIVHTLPVHKKFIGLAENAIR
jgi:predicted nucleotidyltransferase